MKSENRVAKLLVEKDPESRRQMLRSLSNAPALQPDEVADLCSLMAADNETAIQIAGWKLLEQTAPSSKALDLALACVMNPEAEHRGEAIRYLRFCFPDRLPGLLDVFGKDPDEEVRYQLSEFLRDSDIEAAVGMKIRMLAGASEAKRPVLVGEIAELGNLFHLEALRGLDQMAGGNSVYARAAELLAGRTRSQEAGG